MLQTNVSLDGFGKYEALIEEERWNGFCKPWFTLDTLKQIAREFSESAWLKGIVIIVEEGDREFPVIIEHGKGYVPVSKTINEEIRYVLDGWAWIEENPWAV